jgi:hypothetical protein
MEERLERGEVVYFAKCPFPVAEGDDRLFLLDQRLAGRAHKNISYNPATGKAKGFALTTSEQGHRLQKLLANFAETATAWLAKWLPTYAAHWQRDQVSFRPEEEATRQLRQKARNDLIHVDAFPSRPTNGKRILRLFVNVNPTDPRIWVTSDPFAKLLDRFGKEVGLPYEYHPSILETLKSGVLGLFNPKVKKRSAYDSFMLRFHDFLKANDKFQEKGPKRFWRFPPNSLWLAITDTASHAVLRGRYALEHSYFIQPQALALPNESPPALLAKVCGKPVLPVAA